MPTAEQPSDEVRQKALDMVREDFLLNDSVHTPPGAIGHYLPPSGEGPESAGDREPRRPLIPSSAGAIALTEIIDEDTATTDDRVPAVTINPLRPSGPQTEVDEWLAKQIERILQLEEELGWLDIKVPRVVFGTLLVNRTLHSKLK